METYEQTADRNDTLERLHQQLQESLQDLVTSDDWQQALAVAARFHDYSFANTQLIWAQSVARGFTPSRVAGYRAWQELGRHVRRGERGLQILAPVVRKITLEENGEEERRVVGYRVVHVFDQGQTEGQPLPEVAVALVEGDLPGHWNGVDRLIRETGFGVQVADLDRLADANGVTDWLQREVVVRASLPGAQRFKTAVHELAHIRLHEPNSDGRPTCRGVVEVEAESVAYMVCAALGIDSAGYSLPYVASWSGGDLTKVAATAGRVVSCARTVLTQLEQERRLEREPARSGARLKASDATTDVPSPQASHRADLEEILTYATAFYQHQLQDPLGTGAAELLRSRGISDEAVDGWQLGFAPDTWQSLTNSLRGDGFSEDLIVEAGVVGRSQSGRIYDRMRNRVIFPILDEHGRPRGLAGRLLSGDGPKYLNSPETELYQKRSLLYGLHLAQQPIADSESAIVVEGYIDAIAAHQAGFTNVVATAGTALTPEHLENLSRITNNVILAFDGDQAGLLAAERSADLDTAPGPARLFVAHLPERHDPADLLTSGGNDVFEQAIAEAVPLEHHLIDQIVRKHNLDEPEATARAIRAAGTVVTTIADPGDRERTIGYLSTRIGRDEAIVRSYLDANDSFPRRSRARDLGRGIR